MANGREEAQQTDGEGSQITSREHHNPVVVVDGRDIAELVKNEAAFSTYVDHKFQELDRDGDGKLSLKELEPAVADIGAAIGLPARGSSPDSDHIYGEVLNEFTNGRRRVVSKNNFKEVLSDILLGMAAGLQRDPVVILRIDGEELKEFVAGLDFEPEAAAIFSESNWENLPLRKIMVMSLEQLGVSHGMPPISDSLVFERIVQPAMSHLPPEDHGGAVSREIFMEELRKVLCTIASGLKDHPVIVAHSENYFDGSGITRLLSSSVELDQVLDMAWKELPKKANHKVSKEYLRVALDGISSSAGLPPYGAIADVDAVINETFKTLKADDGQKVREAEFKKLMKEILGTIGLQLGVNPISVSANSVVHEPLSSPSTLLPVLPQGEGSVLNP
ncbi:calcium-binding EF-hand family protein [Wolffia australiana]